MRGLGSVIIFTLLLIGMSTVTYAIQPIRGDRSKDIVANETLSPDFVSAYIHDVTTSLEETIPGPVIHIYVTYELTWDVLDYSGYWVEAYVNGTSLGRKTYIVLGSGHEFLTADFVWNTSEVEGGLYLVTAATSTFPYYEDGYVRIQQTFIVPDEYPTIQAAINAANERDFIFVRNGTYYEHVVVNKSVSLIGEAREATIIDGSGIGDIVEITADRVLFTEFTVRNTTNFCVFVHNSTGTHLRHNIIENFYDYGIYTLFSNNTMLTDNTVIGQHWNDFGVRVTGSNCCIITGNDISGGWALFLHRAYNSTVMDNVIFAKGTYGIRFSWSHGNILARNDIYNATATISEVAYGIWISYSSTGNTIYHNNFYNNTIQAHGHNLINFWDNGCEGNYWSNYNGSDSNGDGLGEQPYVIDGNNTDHYPLVDPYWNPGDINHDFTVDIFDVVLICDAYYSTPIDPNWNCHCDIVEPYGLIDLFDVVVMADSYGEEYYGP